MLPHSAFSFLVGRLCLFPGLKTMWRWWLIRLRLRWWTWLWLAKVRRFIKSRMPKHVTNQFRLCIADWAIIPDDACITLLINNCRQ
jgi:hypothetical protein